MAETKKKRRFNVVDALIILIILVILAGGGLFLWTRRTSSAENTFDVEYVVEFRTVRDELTTGFAEGVKLVDSVKKYQLGEVIAVNITPAKFTGTDLVSGDLVYTDYPEHSNVALTVRATASLGSDGMYIIDGGYRISVGTTMYVRSPGYVGTGYCTRFKKAEVR